MSARFLGEFTEPQALVHAARVTRQASTFRVVDAFSPFSVDGLAEEIEPARSSSRIRPALLLGGLAGGAAGALLQWYSAVVALPLIVGGRPLASWPDFFFATFELAILGAALAGFGALLWSCGLPRLHHPLFDVPGFERVTQDRFFLEIEADGDAAPSHARQHLHALGALRVEEIET